MGQSNDVRSISRGDNQRGRISRRQRLGIPVGRAVSAHIDNEHRVESRSAFRVTSRHSRKSAAGQKSYPRMTLICACCGGQAPARKQWFNQDKGYGICARCFTRVVKHERTVLGNPEAEASAIRSYGRAGEHHSLRTLTLTERRVLQARAYQRRLARRP